ncbi:MAG: AMP-binding protein [Acidimicrobiales bacterium]
MKELTFHRWYLPWVERWPDELGYADIGGGSSTYGQHTERVFQLASALNKQLGIQPDDRVAVLALNSRPFMELYHAAYLGGCVTNPLNLRFAAKELEFVLRDSGTKVVFVDFLFAGAIDQIRAAAGVEQVVLIGDPMGDAPHDVRYEDLVAAGDNVEPAEPEEDDPCLLMYTGGTTGTPKGVVCTQRAEILNGWHARALLPLESGHVALLQTPMFHAASMGFVVNPQQGPAPVQILPMFDPGKANDAVETYGVTVTVAVPTMIQMMLNHPEFRPERWASMQHLVYGASPMPTALLQRIQSLFPELNLAQGYGMTESSALLTGLSPDDHRDGGDLLRSAGRALPGIRLSIQDPDGNRLPTGQTGEVCAQGGNFMTGYWNRPEQTEEAFRGGWYHSGDAGYLDERGYLFLVDRVKDMIVTGGENVYCAEVENAVGSHPAVAQVAVIGIPSQEWGEAVHAIVVLNEGASATEDDLIAHARQSIAGYKIPKSVEFRTEPLPLSGAMKVLKRELRAPYWEGHERSVG